MGEPLKVVAAKPALETEDNQRRTANGRWTLAQLRQTDGVIPLQSGTNQFDSQKGKTCFGTPRNTQTAVQFADDGKKYSIEQLKNDSLIRLQSGTNKFESQKRMTSFGSPRDVKGKHLKRIWELEFPQECPEYQYEQQRLAQLQQAKETVSNGTNGTVPSFGQQQHFRQQKGYSNTQNH